MKLQERYLVYLYNTHNICWPSAILNTIVQHPNFQELCIPVAYQFPGNPQQIQIKHFPFLVSPIPFVFLRISGLVFCISAKLDGVKTYMRMRRVPNHLQVKVIKWFDYLWLTQKCSDEERAVSCLPDKLKVSTRGRLRLRNTICPLLKTKSFLCSPGYFRLK